MNRIATEFLTRCFYPGETIAVLLRNGKHGEDATAHRDDRDRYSRPIT